MKHLTVIVIFWVMWSGTTVSKNEKGGLTFRGGYYNGPAAETPNFLNPSKKYKPGDTIWHKVGLFFDTRKDCELEVEVVNYDWNARWYDDFLISLGLKKWEEHYRQDLVCLPNGVIPK